MASASPVRCSGTGLCWTDTCFNDEECGPNCKCYPDDKEPIVVSSLLLLARSKLTCNHFTAPGSCFFTPESDGVKKLSLELTLG